MAVNGGDLSNEMDIGIPDEDAKLQIIEDVDNDNSEIKNADSLNTPIEICDQESTAEPVWPGVSRCRKCGFTTDLVSLLDVHTCLPKSASRLTKVSETHTYSKIKSLDRPIKEINIPPQLEIPLPKLPIQKLTVSNGIGTYRDRSIVSTTFSNSISLPVRMTSHACNNVTSSKSGADNHSKANGSNDQTLPQHHCITDDSEIDKTINKDMTTLTTIVKRIDQNTFACSTCNVNLPFTGFVKHWVCHVKEYPFICYSCSKKFRFEDEIQRHIKASNGKLRYGLIGFKHAKSVLQSLRVGGQITKRGVYVRVPVLPSASTTPPTAIVSPQIAVTCISPKTSMSSATTLQSQFISPVTLLSVSPDGTVTGIQQIEQRMVLGQTNIVNSRPYPAAIPVYPVSLLPQTVVTAPIMAPISQPVLMTTGITSSTLSEKSVEFVSSGLNPTSVIVPAHESTHVKLNVITQPQITNIKQSDAVSPTLEKKPVITSISSTCADDLGNMAINEKDSTSSKIENGLSTNPVQTFDQTKLTSLVADEVNNDINEKTIHNNLIKDETSYGDKDVSAVTLSDVSLTSVTEKTVKDTVTEGKQSCDVFLELDTCSETLSDAVIDSCSQNYVLDNTIETVQGVLCKILDDIDSHVSSDTGWCDNVIGNQDVTRMNDSDSSKTQAEESIDDQPEEHLKCSMLDNTDTSEQFNKEMCSYADCVLKDMQVEGETESVVDVSETNLTNNVDSTDDSACNDSTASSASSSSVTKTMTYLKPSIKKSNAGRSLSQIVNTLKSNAVKSSVVEDENSVKSGTVVASSSSSVVSTTCKEMIKPDSIFKIPQKVVGQHDHNHGKVKQTEKIISYVQKPVDIRSYFYVCGFRNCSFASLYSEQFRGHLVMCHSGLQSYPCPHCLHESSGEEELYRHLLTHSSSKQFLLYRCNFEECSYASNVVNEFRDHNIAHHSDKHAYTCCNCSAMFSSIEELMSHVDSALLKFVQCVHCNVKSKSRKTILEHMKNEHPMKGRQISVASQLVCYKRELSESKLASGYTFVKVTNLASDRTATTPIPKAETQKPSIPTLKVDPPKQDVVQTAKEEPIDYSTHSDKKLDDDDDDAIADDSQLHKCSLCPYESTSTKRISNHKRVHLLPTSNKRYLCNYCPIGFDSYDRFMRHVNIYPGVHTITFFNCNLCSYVTNRQSHIQNHIDVEHPLTDNSYKTTSETVTSEEYKCNQCSFVTRVLGQLTYHKQMHQPSTEQDDPNEEISPLKLDCRFCPKDFNTLTALERHLANHAESAGKLNAYRCVTCSAMGTSVTALKNHWRTTHGMGPARIKRIRRNIRFKATETLPVVNSVMKQVSATVSVPYPSHVFQQDKTVDPDDIRYNGEPRIVCYICHNTFKKWASLRVHMSKHPNRQDFNAYQCISCKLRSTSYDYLVQHCIQIHGQSPNTKPRISDIVVRAGDTKGIGTSPFSRINWSISPPRNNHLNSPKRDVMKAGQCVVCKNDYERICGLMVHVQNTHLEIPEVMVYKCFTCRRRSTSKAFMNNHILESHNGASTFKPIMLKVRRNGVISDSNISDAVHQCPTCEFTTFNLAEYRFHLFNCDDPNDTGFDFSMPTSSQAQAEEDATDCSQNTKSVFADYQKCRYCNFKTKIQVNMQRHMVWHESSNKLNPLKRLNFKAECDGNLEGNADGSRIDSPTPDCPEKLQPEYKIVGNNIIQCTLCDYASFNKTSVRKHFSNKHRRSLENRGVSNTNRIGEGIIQSSSNYGEEDEYYAGKPTEKISPDNFMGEDMYRQIYHYRCKLCQDYWSPQYNAIMNHLDTDHSAMDKTNYYSYYMYECRICFKHVKKECRDQHKAEHDLSLRCTYCDFSTGHRKALTSHMLSHFKYKRFRCQYCWHTTAFRSNIRLHVTRMHPDKKPVFDIKYDESVRRKVMSIISNIRLASNTSKSIKKEMPSDVLSKSAEDNYIIKCVMCEYTSHTIDVMKLHYDTEHPGHQCKWKRRLQECLDVQNDNQSPLLSSQGENDEYILCQPTPNKLSSPRRHMNANDVCFPAGPLVSNGQHEDGSFYKQCKICKAKFNAAGSSASYRHIYREHMPACYQCAYCEYRAYPSSTVNVHCRGKHPEVPEAYILVKDEAYKQFEYFYNKISMGMEIDYDITQDRRKATRELDAFRSNGVMFPARILCLRTADGNGYQCRLCGASFNSLSRLPYDHLYSNHLPQCFKCPYCNYRAYPRSVVMKHVIKHHPGETKKTILIKDETFVEFTKLYEKLKESCDDTLPSETGTENSIELSSYRTETENSCGDIADLYIEETQSPDIEDMQSRLIDPSICEDSQDSELGNDFNEDGSYMSEELADGYMSGDSGKFSELGQLSVSGKEREFDIPLNRQDLIPSDMEDSLTGSYEASLDDEQQFNNNNKRTASPESDSCDSRLRKIPRFSLPEGRTQYRCNWCSFCGLDVLSLEAHLATHEEFECVVPKEVTVSTCGFCDVSVTDHDEFTWHTSLHIMDHPNCCGYCDFTSFQRDDVKSHLLSCHPYLEEEIISVEKNCVAHVDRVVNLNPELRLVDLADIDASSLSDSESSDYL